MFAESMEVRELLAALRENRISPDQSARLNQLLAEHREARQMYLKYFSLVAVLRWMHDTPLPDAQIVDAVLPATIEPNSPAPVNLVPGRQQTALLVGNTSAWAFTGSRALVALCFYGLFVVLAWNLRGRLAEQPQVAGPVQNREPGAVENNLPGSAPAAENTVAWVGGSANLRWSASGPERERDSAVRQGEALEIDSGLVELKLAQGVRLLIEGPAHWSIDGPNRATLREGRLLAEVPRHAVGFTLRTPTTTVVDLGTEFGVEVSPQRMEVCVLKGEVSVQPEHAADAPAPELRLKAGESLVSTPREAQPRPEPSGQGVVGKYERLKEHPGMPASKFIDRFWQDPACLACYDFVPDPQQPARLVNRAVATAGQFDGQIHGARVCNGSTAADSALEFDENAWVALDIPGLYQQLSLVASVRLAQHESKNHSGLLMTDSWQQPGQLHWQFSDRQHVACAIHGAGDFVTDAPVQPERWLVTALTCDTETGQLSMYVDGALVGEYALPARTPLKLGTMRIGHWQSAPFADDKARGLIGSVDQLVIFSRTLKGFEVRQFQP